MYGNALPETLLKMIYDPEILISRKVDMLISLLEKSDTEMLRISCLSLLKQFRYDDPQVFNIFENCLISDEFEKVRSFCARILIGDPSRNAIELISWSIKFEESTLVLNEIFKILKISQNSAIKRLLREMELRIEEISQLYGIDTQEIPFLLEMPMKLNQKDLYEHEFTMSFFQGKDFRFVIKDKHIIALSLNGYEKLPESVNVLTELLLLDLKCNMLTELPCNMKNLSKLTDLILSWNAFQHVPDVIEYLPSLKELDLSHNQLDHLPSWFKKLEILKHVDLKDNKFIG
jgi:hypothetical protein